MDTFGEDTFAGDNNANIAFTSPQRSVDVETSDRPDQTKSKYRFSCFEISLPNCLLNFARDTSNSRIFTCPSRNPDCRSMRPRVFSPTWSRPRR